jgi:hypothetical protein
MPIANLDTILRLYEKTNVIKNGENGKNDIFKMHYLLIAFLRKLKAYYFKKKIRPYLKYDEAIELDESKVG